MLRAAPDDASLLELEKVGFGVAHDALGAALCESWGLAAAAVASVRHHVGVLASGELPQAVDKRPVCGLSVIANALLFEPEALEPAIERIAPQVAWEPARVLKAARRVQAALDPITV
jgi:hypothetical protein